MSLASEVVARWSTSHSTRLEKILTGFVVLVLIVLGGGIVWDGASTAVALSRDAGCKIALPPFGVAPERANVRGGACTIEPMHVARVHIVRGRSSNLPYIVLERSNGQTFDLDLRGNEIAAVYGGILRRRDDAALVKTLYGSPIEIVTRSGRAEFDTHADWAVSALGALMLVGGSAGAVFGPDRRRPR